MRQTTYPKNEEFAKREWLIVDIKDCVLGRVASRIASVLIGKNNINYTFYSNNSVGIIVINASKIKLIGNNKLKEKFYWHTGYPGGIKSRTFQERLNSNFPENVFYKAVERMVPRNSLGRMKMKNLRVFPLEVHNHSGLKPKIWNLADENNKNKLRINNG